MFLSIGHGTPSYTAQSMWELCATIVDNKIDANLRPPRDADDDGIMVTKNKKKKGDLITGYTVSDDNDEGMLVDVRRMVVGSQETADGEYVHKELCWFSQHDGDPIALEIWFHRMWLKAVKDVPNIELKRIA